ncbi:hypothetical protein GGI20_004385 [Coemansia sp. BCRC 34301]|nr:hypothetical protein GGI20_004385 [Coemansia sp. BCRC 34301]
MLFKFILFTTLAIVSVAARGKRPSALPPSDPGTLQQLKCRTSPKESALLVRTYGDQDIIDLQCQIAGGPATNHTLEWLRTGDNCYVPAYYVNLDDASRDLLPGCAAVDGSAPCVLPNRAGFDLLERVEGFLDRPHGDVISGLPFIGFGHQCMSPKCDQEPTTILIPSFPMSRTQASVLLWHDVRNATMCLARLFAAPRPTSLVLSDNMWSALASWVFGVGCDLAAQSQLIRRIRRGESPAVVVPSELPKWTVVRGKQVADLAARRDAELALFRTQSSRMAYPRCDQ